MNFPYFGDAEAFLALGARCAQALEQGGAFAHCYNGLRPIGSFAYFSLPYLLSSDPVTVLYLLAGMNVLMFVLLQYAMVQLAGNAMAPSANGQVFKRVFILIGTLVLSLPFIPVALSDLPAVAFFMLGLALLFRGTQNAQAALLAGLSLGVSCLIKQNYYVFTVIAVAVFAGINVRHIDRALARRFALFCAGSSVALLQIAWVYLHTGRLYPYSPADGFVFDEARRLPFIELVAYSLPAKGAYMSSIDSTSISALSHFCIKLLQGFFAYRPAVYLGFSPAESPAMMHLNKAFLLKAYVSTFALGAVLVWAAAVSTARERTLLVLSLVATFFTAWYIHVENRYFFMPKLLLVCWLGAFALPALWAKLGASARAAMNSVPPPGGLAADTGPSARQIPVWRSPACLAAYGVILELCFLTFQQQDLRHTIASSYGYLRGHWADFYDYNAAIVGRNDYLPGIYAVFAVWFVPLKALGLLTDVATKSFDALSMAEVLWGKLLPVGFFFATVAVMKQIAGLVSPEPQAGWRVAAVFATAPLAIFGVFFMGQYDIVAVFLMACGLYFYFQRRLWLFAVAFSLAIPFKYFAIIFFFPLLVLATRSWIDWLKYGALALAATLLQGAMYWGSAIFRQNIFVLPSLKAGLPNGASFFGSALFFAAMGYAAICVAVMFWHPKSDREWHKRAILVCTGVAACFFARFPWHPQWLIFAMPFFALTTLYLKRPALWYVAEVLGVAAFGWLCANYWGGNVDASMVQQGSFRSLFPVLYLQNSDLMGVQALPLMRALFIGYLFAPLVLLLLEKRAGSGHAYIPADKWIAGRFLASMAILLIPSLYCAFASESQAVSISSQAALITLKPGLQIEKGDRTAGEITAGRVVEQEFEAGQANLTAIGVRFATYARLNDGDVDLLLHDSSGQVMAQDTIAARKLRDNQFYGFRFPPVPHSAGQRFTLSIKANGASPGRAVTAWISDEVPAQARGALKIGDRREAGILNIKLMYVP